MAREMSASDAATRAAAVRDGAVAEPISGHEHVFIPGASGWTLLLLHGTGGDEHDLVPLGRQLAPRAALLGVRGSVLENGTTPRFFRRHSMDEFDIADLRTRTDTLARFVQEAAEQYQLNPQRIIAIGLSNGANIASELLFCHPKLLAGAALLRAMLIDAPGDRELSLADVPVLIAAGERDPLVSQQNVSRLADEFTARGADVTLNVEPGAGHSLVPVDLVTVKHWFERVFPSAI